MRRRNPDGWLAAGYYFEKTPRMRQIGKLPTETQAQRFAAFLITQDIAAHTEADGDGFVIWVRDENQIDRACDELDRFKLDPRDRRYEGVEQEADARLQQQQQQRQQARKNIVQVRGKWKQGTGRRATLIFVLIGMSVLIAILTNFAAVPPSSTTRLLLFRDPAHLSNRVVADDVFVDVKRGQLWRLVSPVFIHGSTMHLVFNMYMFYVFGSQVEDRRGTLKLALLVLLIALISNVAQAVIESAHFGGMSGVVYGLFGYVWMKTRFDPSSGMYVNPVTVMILIAWLFLCFTGLLGSIANTAHFVGLAVGVVAGYAPLLIRPQGGR